MEQRIEIVVEYRSWLELVCETCNQSQVARSISESEIQIGDSSKVFAIQIKLTILRSPREREKFLRREKSCFTSNRKFYSDEARRISVRKRSIKSLPPVVSHVPRPSVEDFEKLSHGG